MSENNVDAARNKELQTEELLKKFRNAEKEMVASSVESFYRGLVLEPIENPAKLPEDIFVNVFLPYFRGDKNFNDSPNLLGEWYAIAGSHVSEVQIIARDGSALYNVPPYINNKGVNPQHNQNRDEMSLHDIDGSAEAMSRNIPIMGKNFRERKMAEKIVDMTITGVNPNDYLARWKGIFERYAPVTTSTNSDAPSAAVTQKSRVGEDEMEF